jgi:hypothetical protein
MNMNTLLWSPLVMMLIIVPFSLFQPETHRVVASYFYSARKSCRLLASSFCQMACR